MVEESKSVGSPILRWGALAFGGLLWGAGVAAMYGDDYTLAVALYFIGIAVMAADLFGCPRRTQQLPMAKETLHSRIRSRCSFRAFCFMDTAQESGCAARLTICYSKS
jgi:hypothetical protein